MVGLGFGNRGPLVRVQSPRPLKTGVCSKYATSPFFFPRTIPRTDSDFVQFATNYKGY